MQETGNNPILRVEGIRLRRDGREILRDVHLSVVAGEVHGLLGPNGSGKSSLAYTLMGFGGYAPDQGAIWFAGREITQLSITERARMGMTLAWQEPARFEGLRVAEYLALGRKDLSQKELKSALEAVALAPAVYLGRAANHALSGGERKRIELAAVSAMRPKLVILDEPDSGIDTLTLGDVQSLIRRLADQGTAVLLITHRDEIISVADSASLMCQGSIVFRGAPMEVQRFYGQRCRPHVGIMGAQPWPIAAAPVESVQEG